MCQSMAFVGPMMGVRFLVCLPGTLRFFFLESVGRALNASVVHIDQVSLGI